MGSLHDHDRLAYAEMIFQLSRELSEDSTFETGPESGAKEAAERHLRSIIKLGQTSVIFTVFENAIKMWLDLLPSDHRQVCCFYSLLTRFLTDRLVLSSAHPSVQQRGRSSWPRKRNPRQLYLRFYGRGRARGHRSLENFVPSCFRKQREPQNRLTVVLHIRALWRGDTRFQV